MQQGGVIIKWGATDLHVTKPQVIASEGTNQNASLTSNEMIVFCQHNPLGDGFPATVFDVSRRAPCMGHACDELNGCYYSKCAAKICGEKSTNCCIQKAMDTLGPRRIIEYR